jgi:hypothetical protein
MPREEMPFHPAANIFPLDDESIGSLADDIRTNGQQVPIEIMDGQVLDGRRRWLACSIAQIEPLTRTVKVFDPVAYVLSLNLHRRHLNTSQLAMVAARARELYDEQAKERQRASGGNHKQKAVVENLPQPESTKARDAAGKAVGVSGRSVDFAKKVIEQGTPELVKAVDEGKMAVSTAAFYATEPEEVQRTVVSNPKRNRKYSGAAGGGQQDEQDQEEHPEKPTKKNGRPPVGVTLANEALNVLMRIPKDDSLRKRGFQIVTDWIKTNR